jgi:hypothetical protein
MRSVSVKDLALVQALIANGIEKASMFSTRSDVGPTRVSMDYFYRYYAMKGCLFVSISI